jgi:uncharacterized protein (DUF983 family)
MDEFTEEESKSRQNGPPDAVGQPCSTLSRGDWCPQCAKGRMDYNGFLILTCPECGFQVAGGGFT